jgi:hypothetical protein
MSKIKNAIETALESINGASHNTYGAKIYTFEQVAMILQDLLETASENGADIAGGTITQTQIDQLVALIEVRIDTNINNMSDSDIVDGDSIEMSISGGRATIEDIDVDKDNIISEAQYGIDDEINNWADRHGIVIEAE